MDEATLRMLHELKTRNPEPWIERFSDVTDLRRALNREFVNQLYLHFQDREKQTRDIGSYLLDKITEAAPEVRNKIALSINPDLVADREALQARLADIETALNTTRGQSDERIAELEKVRDEVQQQLSAASTQLEQTRLLLARSVMKDISWLDFIRRTLMARQPARVPFHNSMEVALRGYHAAAGAQRVVPALREVTWERVSFNENGLHRGYYAAIVLRGEKFVPGVVFAHRRRGETAPPASNSDYLWRLPNIYFGDYLEVASGGEEPEAALSWRDHEFAVRNPEGHMSEWVLFAFPFDDEVLKRICLESYQMGSDLLARNEPGAAVEPLRKAYVFSDRLFGREAPETQSKKATWERALDAAALAKLRFRVGEEVRVTAGPHLGDSGVIEKLMLRHLHAYVIKPVEGELFQASDAQVESMASTVDQ
ncbi:MAG: KOW motif-containing protein [Steroidobacteraceae bacterium]